MPILCQNCGKQFFGTENELRLREWVNSAYARDLGNVITSTGWVCRTCYITYRNMVSGLQKSNIPCNRCDRGSQHDLDYGKHTDVLAKCGWTVYPGRFADVWHCDRCETEIKSIGGVPLATHLVLVVFDDGEKILMEIDSKSRRILIDALKKRWDGDTDNWIEIPHLVNGKEQLFVAQLSDIHHLQ